MIDIVKYCISSFLRDLKLIEFPVSFLHSFTSSHSDTSLPCFHKSEESDPRTKQEVCVAVQMHKDQAYLGFSSDL